MYTVRDSDVVVTDIKPGMFEHVTKGTFPGRAPLLLVGTSRTTVRRTSVQSVEQEKDDHKKFVVAATRDGKGIVVANNETPFKVIATKEVSFWLEGDLKNSHKSKDHLNVMSFHFNA